MDQNEFEYNINHPYFEDLRPEKKKQQKLRYIFIQCQGQKKVYRNHVDIHTFSGLSLIFP